MNDRLYLAANSGLIVCLHDREYTKPIFHQKQLSTGTANTPEELKKLALENLSHKVSHPGFQDPMPLREAIEKLRKSYNIRLFCFDRAFLDSGKQPVNDKLVTIPKVNDVPLGDLIKQIVGQVGGTYELTGDVIQIVPLTDKRPMPPPGAPPPPPG